MYSRPSASASALDNGGEAQGELVGPFRVGMGSARNDAVETLVELG